jgi:hypothetical protein
MCMCCVVVAVVGKGKIQGESRPYMVVVGRFVWEQTAILEQTVCKMRRKEDARYLVVHEGQTKDHLVKGQKHCPQPASLVEVLQRGGGGGRGREVQSKKNKCVTELLPPPPPPLPNASTTNTPQFSASCS